MIPRVSSAQDPASTAAGRMSHFCIRAQHLRHRSPAALTHRPRRFNRLACLPASRGAPCKRPPLELRMSEVSEAPPLPAATLDELVPIVFEELRRLARAPVADVTIVAPRRV
jgi:hypothetical protein